MRGSDTGRVWPLDQKVDPSWTALVVVDVQNDFAIPKGACEVSGDDLSDVAPVIGRLKTLLDAAREKEVLILHVRMNNDAPYVAPNLAEIFKRRGLGVGPCQSGTVGSEFVDGVGPVDAPNEVVLTKHRFSAFWGSSIDLILRSNGIKTVVMAGIATEVCVESTARDAAFRDYSVVMLRDCTGSFSRSRHEAAHTLFDRSFGVVAESADVIAAWSRSNTTERGWKAEAKLGSVLGTLEARAAPPHTALLLIGMAEANQAGTLSEIAPRTLGLLRAGRRAGVMVIHVRSDYGPAASNVGSPAPYRGRADGEKATSTLSATELAVGQPTTLLERVPADRGPALSPELAPRDDEPIVVKHRFSAFHETDLDLLLRANSIRTVVVAGQPVESCVDTTAREVSMRDYYLVVPGDCVAAASRPERQQSLLDVLGEYFGLVVPSQRLRQLWGDPASSSCHTS